MNIANKSLRLIVDLTKREFKMRYLGSVLGSYWNLIHPLMMITIYTLVFSKVMKTRLGSQAGGFSYSLYLCSGLLAWNLFNETVQRGATTLVDNAAFLKKVAFPPWVLFAASAASCLINFCISFAIFYAVLMLVAPISLSSLFYYFFYVGLFFSFGFCLGVSAGCLNVLLRDVQQFINVIFQLWFWFTPIIYLTEVLPDFAKQLLIFNPAFVFIEPMHDIIYFQREVDLGMWGLGIACAWIVLAALLAKVIYSRSISIVRDAL